MIQRSGIPSLVSSWVRLIALSLLLGLGLLAGALLVSKPVHAQSLNTVTITDCTDDSQLQSAVANAASGDTITFGCSGDIKLTRTLTIATNQTLDGSGQNVILDGNNSVEVLLVNSGVTLTLNALTVSNGTAPLGVGGGIDNNGTVTITNSTLSSNSVRTEGGGIDNNGTMTITNSTLSSNSSSYTGGGIDNNGTVTITNSTLSGNSANSAGGGIDNNGTMTIINSTLSSNSANYGGGIFNKSTVTSSGSIVAENTGGDCYIYGTPITDNGYNLDSSSSCFTASTSLHANPELSPLANNGGPTQTMALQQGSPAIDQIPAASCPSTDQRGVSRPDNAETTCDIGAYEFVDPVDNDLGLTNMPANITTNATSAQGAVVTYTLPTVVDEDSPLPPVICTPTSGSTFAIGTTTVTCTVSDNDDTNSPVSQSFSVTVLPVLSATVSSVTATEGSSFSGVVATGTAYGTSNPLTATISWGDGSSSAGSVTLNSDGSYSVSGSHTYAEEGSYALAVMVKDSGNLSTTANGTAKVADAALTLTIFAASSLPHRSAGVAATFTDADPAGQVSDYTATVNWGDGTTSTVKVVKNPLGKGFVLAADHSYTNAGTYTLTLTVTDQGGSQVSKSATLTVK